tara:strand:- start:1615 stop:1962 length:348 start_codon:yes stop_codon:yes gene_type:complete
MEQKPFSGETNSQLKLNLLKILVHTLTIVMILGMIIIIFIILKEFFWEPKRKSEIVNFPKIIKIPDKSKLEAFNLEDNNIRLLINLIDGSQQIILLSFEDGIEKSRKYIYINNTD